MAIESTSAVWPRRMEPCPFCAGSFPLAVAGWGWIEVDPHSGCLPEMCSGCEANPPFIQIGAVCDTEKPLSSQPGDLVLALGSGWVACADAMPWNDHYSELKYVVYSPSYGRNLHVCRFQLMSPAKWWCHGSGISGVTHWRLAEEHEHEQDLYNVPRSKLPPKKSRPLDPFVLSELKRWWDWFADYKGVNKEDW